MASGPSDQIPSMCCWSTASFRVLKSRDAEAVNQDGGLQIWIAAQRGQIDRPWPVAVGVAQLPRPAWSRPLSD